MKLAFGIVLVLSCNLVHAGLRVASYNIRNFDYDVRSSTPTNKSHLVQMFDEMNFDLLAIQEINNTVEFERMVHVHFNGKFKTILSRCGGSHQQRLGFIYNKNKLRLLEFTEDMSTVNPGQQRHSDKCPNGSRPLAIGKFKNLETGEIFMSISVHLKSGGTKGNIKKRFKQLAQISKVVAKLKSQQLHNIMIMGDFNSTEYILKNNNYQRFSTVIRKMNLKDATQNLSCTSYWWGGLRDFIQYPSNLDHILLSSELANKRIHSEVYGHCKKLKCRSSREEDMGVSFNEVSDHCPILTELK